MPSSRDVRLAACAPLWLLACTLGPVSADVTMLSETFDSAADFTVTNAGGPVPFFSDGAEGFRISNGVSSLFPASSSANDNVPSGLPAYTGFNGAYLAVEDLKEHATPITLTWAVSGSCSGQLGFSGYFAQGESSEVVASDHVWVMVAVDGNTPEVVLAFESDASTHSGWGGRFAVDTDLDGVGEEQSPTMDAQELFAPITGAAMTTGFVLTIELIMGNRDSYFKSEIAFDDLKVTCSGMGLTCSLAPPALDRNPVSPPFPPSSPPAPPLIPVLPLHNISYVSEGTDACTAASYHEGMVVTTHGYISALAPNGFDMQEDLTGTSFGGIQVYYYPGKLSNRTIYPAIGDLVKVTAMVAGEACRREPCRQSGGFSSFFENFQNGGMTFLSKPTYLEVLSSGHTLVPFAVTTADIGSKCTPASKQLNRLLVTVGPATIISEPNSFNEISIDDGSGPTQLEDSMTSASMHISSLITGGPDGSLAGTVLDSITGVVRYAHVDFEIHPRSAVDIMLAGAALPTIPSLQPTIRCTNDPNWKDSRGLGCSTYRGMECQLLVAVGMSKEQVQELAFSCPESCNDATGHKRHCLPEPPAAPPLSPPPPMPPAIPPAPPSPPPALPPTPAGFQTWSVASGSNCAQELKPSGFMRVSPSKLTLGRAIDWPGGGDGGGGIAGGGGGGGGAGGGRGGGGGGGPSSSATSSNLIGVIFPSIGLNITSKISHTHLVFDIADVEGFSSEALTLRIYGEKSVDVLQPTSANADLSSRPRTTAAVIWQNVEVSTQKHTLIHSPVTTAMSRIVATCVPLFVLTSELSPRGRTSRRLWRRSLGSQAGCQATRLRC